MIRAATEAELHCCVHRVHVDPIVITSIISSPYLLQLLLFPKFAWPDTARAAYDALVQISSSNLIPFMVPCPFTHIHTSDGCLQAP